ncbi:hypothetical protein SCHPADRAFT_940422 [Schizopora paradoxa]|uniref:N-acetyltransferase domain-containing protein n=1 Tax=Schizopora paradoxa TaxID=27342 RepID=A0A0H2RNB7_9AGAM|nr:hypothetical protein SCHPADRAFT_940422 [Schizopora paradoxa]
MTADDTLTTPTNVLGSTSFTQSRIQPTAVEAPAPGKPNSLGSLVRIALCTTTADFEGIAEIELLNFPGPNTHDTTVTEAGTLHLMSLAAHPFRPALLEKGFSPRLWPDYRTTVSRRQKMAADRTSIFLKASVDDEETGKERIVAMAWLTSPAAYKASQRTWIHLLKSELLHPVVDGVWNRVFDQADGTDFGIIDVYKKEVRRVRNNVMGDKPYFALEMFAVHPSCQGRGAGRALLQHCIGLPADQKIPMILESTAAGYPFYVTNAFKVVERGHVEYCRKSYEWPVMVWKLSTLG